VSIIDIVLELEREDVTAEDVNEVFQKAAAGTYKGYIDTNDDELVSVDFRGNENTAIVDLPLTLAMDGGMVKIVAWYDNEWGYSRRIVDMVRFLAEKGWN
jgi:glyceraldehyde-3-phosphate dehydrogenase/erythrose-4-phosphate dehydrogenase